MRVYVVTYKYRDRGERLAQPLVLKDDSGYLWENTGCAEAVAIGVSVWIFL